VADGAVYSGTRFVQAPPRLVADTWLEIHKITTSGAEIFEPLLTYFAGACRAALRETAVFAPHERDDVERAVSRTIAGSWTLRTLPLSLRTDTAPRRPIEITLPDRRDRRSAARSRTRQAVRPSTSPASLPVHILTADSLGWQMAVYGAGRTTLPETPPPGLGPARNRRPGRLLSDNAVHALIMYHDLLAFGPGEASFESPLLTAANLEIDWAATEWKLPSPVRFDWPAPPSTTFFDLDRFRATWSVVIRHPEIVEDTGHERIVERLAFAWLSLGTAVVTKDTAVLMTPRGQELPWRELINRLEHVAGKARARRSLKAGRYVEWLRRVAELLAPEMGLPTQVTDRFVRIPATLSLVWRNNRVAVRQRRAERLQQLFRVDHALAEGVRAYSLATSDFAPERSEVERAPASAPWEQ
jgi:hypothetical protein